MKKIKNIILNFKLKIIVIKILIQILYLTIIIIHFRQRTIKILKIIANYKNFCNYKKHNKRILII